MLIRQKAGVITWHFWHLGTEDVKRVKESTVYPLRQTIFNKNLLVFLSRLLWVYNLPQNIDLKVQNTFFYRHVVTTNDFYLYPWNIV